MVTLAIRFDPEGGRPRRSALADRCFLPISLGFLAPDTGFDQLMKISGV